MNTSKCMCALAVLLLTLSGCGGITLAPVTGTVTYEGNPVPNATVVFQPEGGPTAMGRTDEQGRFELATRGARGVVPGTSRVTITARESMEVEPDLEAGDPDIEATDPAAFEAALTDADMEAMEGQSLIPEKYGHIRTSNLTADVTAGGENDFTFDLVD